MTTKKTKKRKRYKLVWPSQNPAYLKAHPEAARKKKRKRHRLKPKVWLAMGAVLLVVLVITIPYISDNSKLKGLGYSSKAIKQIRKDKLISTILDNRWYNDYMDQSFADGTLNVDYLQLYTAVDGVNPDVIGALDSTDFLLYARLLDKGYTERQCVAIFANLNRFEITPLLVFDYQADHEAYINDCVAHRDTNSQQYFELSGNYYTYYENTRDVENTAGVDMLVNKTWELPSTYQPVQETPLSTYYAATDRSLAKVAADALVEFGEAGRAVGVTFYATSGYRDYDSQVKLYDLYTATLGQAQTDATSARPGFSEHQTGLAMDIAATNEDDIEEYKDTKAYKWTSANCYTYGWILRFPEHKEQITGYSFESWHYRYLGKELATAVQESGMTYDEFYSLYIKNWDDEGIHQPKDEILNAVVNYASFANTKPQTTATVSASPTATAE